MDLWRLEFLGVDVLNYCIANFSYCDTFHLAIITVNVRNRPAFNHITGSTPLAKFQYL